MVNPFYRHQVLGNPKYMATPMPFKIGDNVTYSPGHKKEHGKVKSLSDSNHVFVVYNCNDEWDSYKNYTGARTRIQDLQKGWI